MGGRERERYRALVERAPVGVFEMDAEFHCVYVNERWSEITGVARDDAMGDGWNTGLHPDDEAALANELARALDAADDFRIEHRWVHPDGTVRWVLTLAQVARDGDVVTGFAGTLTDITSEHYAEERLSALVADSSDAIVVIGPDASIQFSSATMTRILGWEHDELVGSMGLDLLHPDDLDAAIATLTELVTKGPGTKETLSYRLHHKDGSWVPVEVVGINLLDDPAVEGIVLNVRDITERVHADRLLAESRERYRQIVETADEGIWTLDASATTTFVNRRMAEMLGTTVEQMTGTSCFDFMDDDARVEAEGHLARARSGERQHAELKLRHTNGDDVWVRGSAAPSVAPDGTFEGITALVTDITAQREIEAQLRYNEARLSALFEASSDIMAVLELNGHWHASPAGTRILGYPMGYDPPGGLLSIVHPDDLALAGEAMQEVIDKTRSNHDPIRVRVRHIDGHYRWFDCTAENRVDDPTVGGLVIIARDITEQKEAEDARIEAEMQFRAAFERSPLGIAMIDLAGNFLAVNPAFTVILGRDDNELIGASGFDLVHADDRDRIVTEGTDRAVGRSDAVPEPIRMLHPDGHVIWVMADVSLVPHPDGTPAYLLALIADVSDRKRLEQDLEYQAFHDPLTNLANRARMRILLDRAWRDRGDRSGQLAVLFVDLDRFKGVNDTLGHDAGDELLILAAERLRRSVRAQDTVARFGGDEFVVICEGVVNRAEAVQIAGRIRETLAHPYQLKAAPAEIAASVGVALDDGHFTVDDLLRDADMAAYRAKELGRNRVEVVGRAVGF